LYEFAVVGMGIAGLSAAIRLREHGYDVVLIGDEKSASRVSAGIITLQLENLKDILLVRNSINIIKNLVGSSRLEEIGVTCRGFISVEDSEEAEESAELLKKAGIDFKQFNSRDASERWPWLDLSEDEVVTYTWDDLSVEADQFIDFLMNIAEKKGVRVQEDWVEEVIYGEKNKLILQRSCEVEAEIVLLCLGAWTRDFLSKNGINIPTAILRCPAYRFRTANNITAFADEVYESYWRPGIDGTIVGGGYHAELVDDSSKFFNSPPRRFRSGAEKLLKIRLKNGIEFVEEWSGPCSITADLDPLMDTLPGHENVLFIDGLRGYGLMRGLALGYLLADIASGRKDLDTVREYRLSRFSSLL